MTVIPLHAAAAQAAVEYGATSGVAGEVMNSLSGLPSKARGAIQVVEANPVLLVGVLLVLVLLFVFFKNPAR